MSAVADTQTDSSKTVTLNDTTAILMSRTPLVATRDITAATASQTDDQWILSFTVADDAAKRVHDFTKQHVGRNLALVVDGKVHGTPRIAAAVIGNRYRDYILDIASSGSENVDECHSSAGAGA